MIACCGIALRSPCSAQALGGLPWPPVRRMRRTPTAASFCDPFAYIVPTMRAKRSQKSARCGSLRCAVPAPRKPGATIHGRPCDACVAPSLRRSLLGQAPERPMASKPNRRKLGAQRHADGKLRCAWCPADPLYLAYHDTEWGVALHDDGALFEMLCLEGAQAGLSWLTVLRKLETCRKAFDGC